GRRGNATSTGTKTTSPVTLDAAEKIYAKLVQEKTSKGYVPDGAGTPFSGIQNAGAVSGLVPMLLNPITEDELEVYLLDDKWFVQEKL
ncbi:hypothetical protein ACI4B7_27650, partial [Klebsiella pneumoniae]|uniref:hypothetical protein n=1 Tax=Klebsiella pneumoniae TaxID=573 RepID=UPI00385189C0